MRVTISVLALVIVGVFVGACRSVQPSADEIRKQIVAELPVGSNKTQVVAFLDSRKATHSDIQDFFELDQEGRRIKTRILTASIPRNTFWTKSQVLMVFYFDGSDRLTKYDVKNVNTGL